MEESGRTGLWYEAGRSLSRVSVKASLRRFEDTVSRSVMHCEEAVGEGLQGNEVNAIRNWRKWSPCYVIAGSLGIQSFEIA